MKQIPQQPNSQTRRGFMVPAAGAMILVIGLSVALVLDRLWIDAAQVEVRSAAEAAALAAASQLCTDDLLRQTQEATIEQQMEQGRLLAGTIASQNKIAGQPLELDTDPEGDIRFGKLLFDEARQSPRFLETDYQPNCVAVFAECTKQRGNPVALLFRELTQQHVGNVSDTAEASIDNRIIGFRPADGMNIPAIPLAIAADAWNAAIEQRTGQDNFCYDETTSAVLYEADGIPEVVLRSAEPSGAGNDANCHWLDWNTRFASQLMNRQIQSGVTAEDLADWEGALRFDSGPIETDGQATLDNELREALRAIIGQKRICVLYSESTTNTATGISTVLCVRPVAGRIIDIYSGENGRTEIVFQPCVMTTRTALTHATPFWQAEGHEFDNPYIHKLYLSH